MTPPQNVVPVHAVFEAHVLRAPHAPALSAPGTSLTYAELDDLAGRAADTLRREGVGAGAAVGVLGKRSVQAIVAMLAILKAGGTYVPLDPAYPRDRLEFMVRASGVRRVVSWEGQEVPPDCAGKLVRLEYLVSTGEACRPWSSSRLAADAAYVMFTSGTSGMPKAVPIPHAGVTRLVLGADHMSARPGDRVTHLATISFDASTLEIWGALLNGAELLLVDDDTTLDASRLQAFLRSETPAVVFLPTALFHHVGGLAPDAFTGLRDLIVGGEELQPHVVRQVFDRGGPQRLINAYGPTENSVISTVHFVPRDLDVSRKIPIGRPIKGTTCHVLRDDGRPAVPGEIGELFVGGSGVGMGYLNDPELTAARFVPDPFGAYGARMYRTGDLASWRSDGALNFHGRRDRQVKIRGFRVEPAEVERALLELPRVARAAVVTRATRDSTRLVAYVVAQPGSRLDAAEIRGLLRTRIPAHMVPHDLIETAMIPLTLSGKVDYDALDCQTIPRSRLAEASTDHTGLTDLIAGVLGRADIDPAAGFVEQGGDSLAAARLAVELNRSHGLNIPVSRILENGSANALAGAIQSAPVVVVRPEHDQPAPVCPASYGQQGIWWDIREDSAMFNELVVLRINGEIDLALLQRCLDNAVARHDSLRTTFRATDDDLWQCVVPAMPSPIRRVDHQMAPTADRGYAAAQEIRHLVGQPLDVVNGPLIRAELHTLANEEHFLAVVIHHLVTDGVSFGIVLREMAEDYTSAKSSTRISREAPRSHIHHARAQRARAEARGYQDSLEYWTELLSSLPIALDLPRRSGPNEVGSSCDLEGAVIPNDTAEALRAFAAAASATPFSVLYAAWAAFLARLSNATDVLLGTVVASDAVGQDNATGYLANLLPVRVDASGNQTFWDFVCQTKNVLLRGYQHGDVPYELILDKLRAAGTDTDGTLVRIVAVSDDGLPQHLTFGPSTASIERINPGVSAFDMRIGLTTTGPEMRIDIRFRTSIYRTADVRSWLAAFVRWLESALARPDTQLSDLPALSEDDETLLRVRCNATATDYPDTVCVHELIDAQARNAPHAVALQSDKHRITYAELVTRTNHVAWRLHEAGLRRGDHVGVCATRSPEQILVALAVLKAGCVYVPLDPNGPSERLSAIAADCALAALVTDSTAVGVHANENMIRLALEPLLADSCSGEPPRRLATPGDVAYIVYTSGSTGKPKGVVIEHRSLVNIVWSMIRATGIGASTRCAAVNPPSFDLGVFDALGPLAAGARVVVSGPDEPGNAHRLARRLREYGVSFLLATPLTWRLLLATGWHPDGEFTAVSSGESLPPDLAASILARGARLWNAYGPAETTIWSTLARVRADRPIAVGRPVANTTTYVLDEHGMLSPIGVVGELHIGGIGVARGYLNQPELTSQRFVPDPFGNSPAARLYRTGDRARWRDDGELELLGRADSQVKVHGYRVECGEVAACLRSHPLVDDAVVRFDTSAGQLEAYMVLAAQSANPLATLRNHLASRLPWYMAPAALKAVTHIPQSPNGKVDHAALANIATQIAGGDGDWHEADLIERVHKIWCEVLHKADVDDDVNLFEQGGHSVHVSEIHARCSSEFRLGDRASMFDVFRHPTVRLYAEHLRIVLGEHGV